jgi:uncharacterized protein (DUF2236 family)
MALQEVIIEKINTRDGIITVKNKRGKEYTANLPDTLKKTAATIFVEWAEPVYADILCLINENEKTPICKGFYVEVA